MDITKVPVFILAGGFGTRISEETDLKPKPMVEVGGIPIIIHLMRWYYSFGFNDFVICAGYKSWEIKRYFIDYEFRLNSVEIDHRSNQTKPAQICASSGEQEKWRVRVIDTGLETMTGARVARAFDEIQKNTPFEDFALSYGDGICNVDLLKEFDFHKSHNKIGTVLGVKNIARFGELDISENSNSVEGFLEKPDTRQGYINGGFFFFKSDFRKYLNTSSGLILERQPLAKLAQDGEMQVYRHDGFWAAMDTLRDKTSLQSLWDRGDAPWKIINKEKS